MKQAYHVQFANGQGIRVTAESIADAATQANDVGITGSQIVSIAVVEATIAQKLNEICGYVENGTDTGLKLYQDDATKSWHIDVGYNSSNPRDYWGHSITEVIDKAYQNERKYHV